jgi:thiol-disulfide isomerase/thioredoxin
MKFSKYTWLYAWTLFLLLSSLVLTIPAVSATPAMQDAQPVVLYFFWGDGCPHCAHQKPFLEELERRYPNLEVRDYEIYHVEENRVLFQDMATALGFEARGVPTTIIGERYWVGYSENIAQEIEAHVAACSLSGCADAGVGIAPKAVVPEPTLAPTPVPTPTGIPTQDPPEVSPAPADPASGVLNLPLIGAIDLGTQSLAMSTAIIAFVDGFNPCSLWVLSILISLTLRTGSRKKIFLIGFVFLSVTSLIYVLFIAGLFTIFTFISFIGWIQVVVALLALFFAIVNIKDYFWYKKGLSFTITDEKKPGLYKNMRKVLNADSLWAMMTATVVMAAGVSLVEFSCTAGFPVLWTNLVAAQGVGGLTFVLLLALYMIIYQIDEMAIFMVAVLTLRANKLEEKHGRILKLIGGTLMLTLAMVMLVNPALMNTMSATLIVFGVALGAAMLILLVHRHVLPRLGIYIGTEMESVPE